MPALRRAVRTVGVLCLACLLPAAALRAQDEALTVNKAGAVAHAAPDIVTALAVSFGGRLAAGLQKGQLAVWPDSAGQASPKIISAHTKRINAVCFSQDAALIATASDDGQVAVWNANTLARVDHFVQSGGAKALTLDVSSDGSALAVGYDNGTVKVWSITAAQPVQTFLKAHQKRVLAVAFAHGDDTTLYSAGDDKVLDTWNVATGEQITQVNLRIGVENDPNAQDLRYRAAAVAGEAKRIAIAVSLSHIRGDYADIVDEHYIKIVSTATGAKSSLINQNREDVSQNAEAALAFSDDGAFLAAVGQTARDDTDVSVFDVKTKNDIGQLSLPTQVQALQFGRGESGWQVLVADGKEVTLFPLTVTAGTDAVPTDALAVAAPAADGADPATQALARATADTMQDAAVNLGRFAVVSRSNLNEVMDELALARTGLVEQKTRLKLGHLVNAQRFLVAKLVPLGAGYHLTVWLEAVETGRILVSKDGEASSRDEVLALARTLTTGLLRAAPSE